MSGYFIKYFVMKIRIEKVDRGDLEQQGVFSWPVWECAPSVFDWHYDQKESCFILEGEITVKTPHEEVILGLETMLLFQKALTVPGQLPNRSANTIHSGKYTCRALFSVPPSRGIND